MAFTPFENAVLRGTLASRPAAGPTGNRGRLYITTDTAQVFQDTGSAWAEVFAGGNVIAANNQTGTTYTLVLGDAGKVIECNNASAIALTIPPNSSVAFPIGTILEVWQQGAGVITLTPGGGVTLRSDGAKLKTTGQYATVGLRKRATDEWVCSGDLSS